VELTTSQAARPAGRPASSTRMIWPPARRITGLVYVAAFALDEGESALDITGRFPGSQLMAALRPATSPRRRW
jgi:hypothetical protein